MIYPKRLPVLAPEDEAAVYYHSAMRKDGSDLPEHYVTNFLAMIEDEPDPAIRKVVADLLQSQDVDDLKSVIEQCLFYAKSVELARWNGYTIHGGVQLAHYPYAVIEQAWWHTQEETWQAFAGRMKDLGQFYGLFTEPGHSYRTPSAMWDVLDAGDRSNCTIMMVANDRGRNEHLIVIRWAPHRFRTFNRSHDRFEDIPYQEAQNQRGKPIG